MHGKAVIEDEMGEESERSKKVPDREILLKDTESE